MKPCKAMVCALCVCACLAVFPSKVYSQAVLEISTGARDWLCELYYQDPFDAFVWAVPDTADMVCLRFQFVPPENVTILATIVNPAFSSIEGSLSGPPGMTVCSQACHGGWTWVVKYTYTFSTRYCSVFGLIPHDDFSEIQVSYCSAPAEFYTAYSSWGDMYPGPDCPCPANEETSWGAIKGMYR